MRTWMIPWLFPAGIVVAIVLFALLPEWVAALGGLVLLGVALPLVWHAYAREHPDFELPGWLPGGRPPR